MPATWTDTDKYRLLLAVISQLEVQLPPWENTAAAMGDGFSAEGCRYALLTFLNPPSLASTLFLLFIPPLPQSHSNASIPHSQKYYKLRKEATKELTTTNGTGTSSAASTPRKRASASQLSGGVTKARRMPKKVLKGTGDTLEEPGTPTPMKTKMEPEYEHQAAVKVEGEAVDVENEE